MISVPSIDPRLAFVLSAMVGHLFGYEAALAIDAQARPLREARAAIDSAVARGVQGDGEALLTGLRPTLQPLAARFFDGLRAGDYDGHLEASTAVRLASLWRYALGISPLEAYQVEHGKVGTPGVVLEDLVAALSSAIDELTRPVDAIKHQAKTVTVGISRSDETLLQVPLVKEVLATGAARDRLSYSTLRTLAALEPLVDRGARLHPVRHRGPRRRRRRRRRHRGGDRPGRPRARAAQPHRRRSRAAGHQALGGGRAHRCWWARAAATAAPSSSCPR